MPQLPFKDKGPVEVTWDYGGTPLIITPYLGTITLRTMDTISEVQEEGYGETPVDAVFTGTRVELEIPMARHTLITLETLLEGVDSGAGDITIFAAKSGCDMVSNAKQIVIKPTCDNIASVTQTEWVLLYKCHPWREFELPFDREGQRVHMVKFLVFVNLDSGYEGRLYQYGVV